MNAITQIESSLKAINQAVFQTLINHLLYFQGNKFIGAPGAVVGKEKTKKGTPDSFFVHDDKYTFVECTTKEKLGASRSFFDKLSRDVEHCFKEDITKIKNEKIDKVILACNESISVEEYNLLNNKVKSYNSAAKFEVLNIQNLPLLLYDMPKLTEEYLNVKIIKGDIYTLKEFLLKTEKGLQPSLTNEFIGREEEVKINIEALKKYDIILLSGSSGVGKSKLAVKLLEELSNDNYIPIVIQSSGVSLWDDYQHLFLPGKQHIILFDDANKSITNLSYLLSKIKDTKSYSAKVIITSRDYAKKQVSLTLDDYLHKEFKIPEFKDEEIGKIIVAALPNLKYNSDIKRQIIDLAKGNARVALMATYSINPESETNYLSSPVLLYEKYFKKISEEIGVFNNPMILKSLAIVSFFGVLDKNNEELNLVLSTRFSIEWNELWSAIMELHNSEILDVYSDEIVKVSDQVLATYAFYKCFIDDKSAVINYGEWISTFIDKFSNRLRSTLIDVNNTFVYDHIKDLVIPHLNQFLNQLKSDEELYVFYNVFWFYKGRECLVYLKKWITNVSPEEHQRPLKFSYEHNNYIVATKHFELLKNFWSHSNELLRPSLEQTLELLNRQPSRLPEVLKFINEEFAYKLVDRDYGYFRQNTILSVLLDNKLTDTCKFIANGIILSLSNILLGWQYTDNGSSKGRSYTIYSFNLYKSDELIKLRERILNQVYYLFDYDDKQSQKILHKIIYPSGDFDKSIYVDELPIYQKLITKKLDSRQYQHCEFVRVLAQHLMEIDALFPKKWSDFIESDTIKLFRFLEPDWKNRNGKSILESESEKRQQLDDFVKRNNWKNLHIFLSKVNNLYKQQIDNNGWHIESAITDIYISIARKDKTEFKNALRLFFSSEVLFPLRASVVNVVLSENIYTAKELVSIMGSYQFQARPFWESVLVAVLPEEQIDNFFLRLLINTFSLPDEYLHIYRMLDYVKYDAVFNEYKNEYHDLKGHNVITYLTSIILAKPRKTRRDFGFDFCTDCVSYFYNYPHLFEDAYWAQYEIDSHFDYDGRELKAVLNLDKNFINDGLKNGKIGLGYSSNIRLDKINLSALWECDDYETLIEDLLITIIEKEKFTFIVENDVYSLFNFINIIEDKELKMKSLILKLTKKHHSNEKIVLMLIDTVYEVFRDWFIEYFSEFLLLNKDISLTKQISFGRGGSWSGSKVPLIQKKIEFFQDILVMINNLPDILEYSEHAAYFEQKIVWEKKDILREQRRDFIEEFY